MRKESCLWPFFFFFLDCILLLNLFVILPLSIIKWDVLMLKYNWWTLGPLLPQGWDLMDSFKEYVCNDDFHPRRSWSLKRLEIITKGFHIHCVLWHLDFPHHKYRNTRNLSWYFLVPSLLTLSHFVLVFNLICFWIFATCQKSLWYYFYHRC